VLDGRVREALVGRGLRRRHEAAEVRRLVLEGHDVDDVVHGVVLKDALGRGAREERGEGESADDDEGGSEAFLCVSVVVVVASGRVGEVTEGVSWWKRVESPFVSGRV
jgi:hypothetical protein